MIERQKKADSLAGMFVILLVLYLLLSVAVEILGTKDIVMPTWLTLIVSEGIILAAGIVYILKNNLDPKEDLGFKKIKIGTFFLCILLGFLAIPVASFVNVVSQFFVSNTMTQASDTLLEGNMLVLLLIVGVFGPACEEIVFRGVLHRGYDRVTNVFRAVLISSLLFGLMHLNVNQACYAFVLGIMFAIVNKVVDSLYPSIIMHVIVNSVNTGMLIVANMAREMMGTDTSLAQEAESVRSNAAMLGVIAVVYLVIGVACIGIAIPVVMLIAKIEGRGEILKSMFSSEKKKNLSENSETEENDSAVTADTEKEETKEYAKVLLRPLPIIALALSLGIMFALEPLMKLLGWA